MSDRLPSLDLLLDLVQQERDRQLTHLDALDTKAGIVLGFAGLLITLRPDVPVMFQILGTLSGSVGIGFALAAFWPRRFSLLEPAALRKYLWAEDAFTRLTVHDSLAHFVDQGSVVLRSKGVRLRNALVVLSLAAVLTALGIVVEAL